MIELITTILRVCSQNIQKDSFSIALLEHCQTHNGPYSLRINIYAAETEMLPSFIPCILLPCKNLLPTLPIMQLNPLTLKRWVAG